MKKIKLTKYCAPELVEEFYCKDVELEKTLCEINRRMEKYWSGCEYSIDVVDVSSLADNADVPLDLTDDKRLSDVAVAIFAVIFVLLSLASWLAGAYFERFELLCAFSAGVNCTMFSAYFVELVKRWSADV